MKNERQAGTTDDSSTTDEVTTSASLAQNPVLAAVYQDLMYFGYEWDADSKKNETDFISEIKEKFPNVDLKDAYDSIKGYRQEVYLQKIESDNYWSWLIAYGWLELSLTGQLMLMDKSQSDKLNGYINLAKSQYPQNFKVSDVSNNGS